MRPKHVLILDDEQERHDNFTKRFWDLYGHRVTLVHRFSGETVTRQDLDRADLVMLDHDLCPAHYPYARAEDCYAPLKDEDSGDLFCPHDTGMHVVRRIISRVPNPTKRFIVHSLNETGAMQMADTLRRYGWRVLPRPYTHLMNLTRSDLKDVVEF